MRHDPLDYAPHTLAADAGIQKMRKLLLTNDYDKAIEQAEDVIVEMRLAKAAINDIKDKAR
jgi:hypothetical protein